MFAVAGRDKSADFFKEIHGQPGGDLGLKFGGIFNSTGNPALLK